MSALHKDITQGRWDQMPFVEQMANIGSEVERALNWRKKQNMDYTRKAFERALELIDLSLGAARNLSRLKELARVRETMVDYFFGTNEFVSTEASLQKYFLHFIYAARKDY